MRIRSLGRSAAALVSFALAAGAAFAQTPPTPAETGSRARATANLASYISDRDYPHEAVKLGEQGTVGFRLDIDPDGRVAACTIIQSSGSAALDSASCRIMTERARFTPARDEEGKAVPDSHISRIRWIMPSDAYPQSLEATAYEKWAACVSEQSAKFAPTRLSPRDVSRKALTACIDFEIETGKELETEIALIPARNQIRAMTEAKLIELRRAAVAAPAR